MYKQFIISLLLVGCASILFGQKITPSYSNTGFYELENTGRKSYNFNVGWRFHKGNMANAEQTNFDDSNWEVVNTPHGLEIVPEDASGGVNYQGMAWYRKYFELKPEMKGKRLTLHFEAIMGKSKVYINGQLLQEFYGGYLPIVIDVTDAVSFDGQNVIAVCADNSDDPMYPPGRPQRVLDFAYFGGIYRDVWLVETNPVYITHANEVNKVAGGGVFIHYENVSRNSADVLIQTHIINESKSNEQLSLVTELKDSKGSVVANMQKSIFINSNEDKTSTEKLMVQSPQLWTPDSPYLYNLEIRIKNTAGKTIDGFSTRVGIRSIYFDNEKGFFLNGEHYPEKLLGANRHQDYALIGNALPNSLHWRDVKKLRDAGLRIIRSAHYPQDPAFMDACNELGMFVIVATPGWQFWNDDSVFRQRIYSDIRQMVRRDRNHPSVIFWEPILNETHYPDYFAKQVHNIVHEEYPFPGAYTACDLSAKGSEHFDVVYRGAPKYDKNGGNQLFSDTSEYWQRMKEELPKQCFFTREWGDNVDDWSSQNSTSRVKRGWGEEPQLIQALHYAKPINYDFYCLERLYFPSPKYIGATFWHAFDHQRGYHPDPFYGGFMDAFRQPKYSYQMFTSQRNPNIQLQNADSGPFIYLAHELTPFSSPDVTVFSNCEEVRLIVCGKDSLTKQPDTVNVQIPYPYFIFEDAYNFMTLKQLHRNKNFDEAYIVAEGLMNGKVVVSHKKMPSKKPAKITFYIDNEDIDLIADGSDIVTIVASITDEDGIVKHLSNEHLQFDIEGEGTIIHPDEKVIVNTEWGTAPILVQSTNKTGNIRVKARVVNQGMNNAMQGVLEFKSVPHTTNMIFSELPAKRTAAYQAVEMSITEVEQLKAKLRETEMELHELQMKQVIKDQHEIEIKRID